MLVAVSSHYKNSASCRTEAEYTCQLRKPFIPLLVEEAYRPDGWLGMMLGSRLPVRFTDNHTFEESVARLCEELGRFGVNALSRSVTSEQRTPKNVRSCPNNDVSNWTEIDIETWLQDNDMSYDDVKTCLGKISGRSLKQMQRMQNTTPQFLYEALSTKLSFNDVVAFTAALNTLES